MPSGRFGAARPGGELGALEAAWREAEEIAAIADTLPDDPLDAFTHH